MHLAKSSMIPLAKKLAGRARRAAFLGLLLSLATVGVSVAQTATTRADQELLSKLSTAAIERTHHSVRYVSDYVRIPYPGGDVPADTGVCTDEVIRSYRALGVDLQKEVHEDMVGDFDAYPHKGQRHPDSNIDHRRVPNLMALFRAQGDAASHQPARRRLLAGRHRGLGSGRRHYPHRHCG
jgi:uncharacterized protein YijF (DUF1287 family)